MMYNTKVSLIYKELLKTEMKKAKNRSTENS